MPMQSVKEITPEEEEIMELEHHALFDLADMLYGKEGGETPQHDTIIFTTRQQQKWAWNAFVEYFNSVKLQNNLHHLPGHPTQPEDYFKPSFPSLDHGTCAAMMSHWASGAKGKVADVPTHSSAVSLWRFFRKHLRECSGREIDRQVGDSIKVYIREDMVDSGQLTKLKKRRVITDADGCQAIGRACFHPSFSPGNNQNRTQMLFWQSIELQTGLRGGASFPATRHPDDDDTTMTYGCFSWHVLKGHKGSGRNKITLEYKPPRHKMVTTEFGSHILTETPELWRDPTVLTVIFATLDDALIVPFDKMLDPGFLKDGEDERTINFKSNKSQEPVFKLADGKRSVITGNIDSLLKQLSLLAGFEVNLTKHSYRRMIGLYMQAKGYPLEVIAMKLGHVFKRVTKGYLQQVAPLEMASLVFDTSSKLLKSMSLHPDMLRSNPNARVALPTEVRLKVLTEPAYLQARSKIDAARKQLIAKYGSYARIPAEDKKIVVSHWNQCRSAYMKRYKAELKKLVQDQTISSAIQDAQLLDAIPENGADCQFDLVATDAMLNALDLRTAADLQEFVDEQDILSGDEETEYLDFAMPAVSSQAQQDTQSVLTNPGDMTVERKYCSLFEDLESRFFQHRDKINIFDTIEKCVKLPKFASAVGSYRPLHVPLGGICPGCYKPVKELTVIPKSKKEDQSGIEALCRTHINQCMARSVLQFNMDYLLDKFPSRIESHPFPTLHTRKKKSKEDPNLLLLTKNARKRRWITCICGEDIATVSLLTAHYLCDCPKVRFWLPLISDANDNPFRSRVKDLENGLWDQSTACFPPPSFYYHDGRYHFDPEKTELFARKVYEDRVVRPAQEVESYGPRQDVVYPPAFLPDSLTDSLPDQEYLPILLRGRIVKREGFCLLCCSDPTISYRDRMIPWTSFTEYQNHCRSHISNLLFSIRSYKEYQRTIKEYEYYAEQYETEFFETHPLPERRDRNKKSIKVNNDLDSDSGSKIDVCMEVDDEDDSSDEFDPSSGPPSWLQESITETEKKKKAAHVLQKPKLIATPVKKPHVMKGSMITCPDIVCRRKGERFVDELDFVKHLVCCHKVPIQNSGIDSTATTIYNPRVMPSRHRGAGNHHRYRNWGEGEKADKR
ncbi:hypothetical protein I204_08545 [Kwoniella mangroviensis CBS 8886]|nr:hypothetical protein I204_08545 [Kwoniella mangroviensis CBS 8886]